MTKWKCPKCKREFAKRNQGHSCTSYPVEKHFKNKENMKLLYGALKEKVKKGVGPFKVESLPCCIHFVSSAATFAGVFIMKGKIRVTFAVSREIKKSRVKDSTRMSTNRYLHAVEITKEKDIDKELLTWLREAYGSK